MAAVARAYTFTDGSDAFGSEVQTEFETIYNAWNNHNSGTSKWTVLSCLNASAVPLIADNSTGTNDIANFKDNGTTVWAMKDGGALQASTNGGAAPTSNSLYKDNIIRAWCSLNGTSTIALNDSFNISAITDNGTGDYTLTIGTDFSNANYAVVCGNPNKGSGDPHLLTFANADFGAGAIAAGSLKLRIYDSSDLLEDINNICVLMIGGQ